ncbi:MAG: hypothetical protein OHK0046_12970 [Anaerolineae bacterium]
MVSIEEQKSALESVVFLGRMTGHRCDLWDRTSLSSREKGLFWVMRRTDPGEQETSHLVKAAILADILRLEQHG